MADNGAGPPLASADHPLFLALRSKLRNSRNFLNVFSYNVRSLFPKMTELRSFLRPSLFHVLAFNETWLKSSTTNGMVSFDGFSCFRNDRARATGGGVALYISKCYKATLVGKSKPGATVEYVLVSLRFTGVSVLVGSVYNPRGGSVVDDVEIFLNFLCVESLKYDHCIIAGDFNIDILKPNQPDVVKYLDVLQSFSFSPFPVNPEVTRPNYVTGIGSCIDHIITKFPEKVAIFDVSPSALSDHNSLSMSYCVKPPAPLDDYKWIKDLNLMDIDFLRNQISLLNWADLYVTPDVDERVNILTDYINYLYDSCVPPKRILIPDARTPWMNFEICEAIRQRDSISRRHQSAQFRAAAQKVRQLIRREAGRVEQKNFDPSLPPKVLWRNFRRLGLAESPDSNSLGLSVESFADFFSNITVPPVVVPPITDQLDVDGFSFRHIDTAECLEAFAGIKSNAVGLDGISIKFLRILLPFISEHIRHVFNHAITCSVFPSSWKEVIVRPIAKVSSPANLSDFRPISITSVLSKAFERIMNDQIQNYINREGLLSDLQSGFRRGHSTTTALVKVTEDLRLAMVEGKATVLVLLDFSKAFDCVNHQLFLYRLVTGYRFDSSSTKLVASFLADRVMMVEVDGHRSSPRAVSSGVPQGAVPSPLFFAMFLDFLNLVIRHCKFHFYADDLQIYLSGDKNDIDGIVSRVNEDLDAIFRWSVENGLNLNASKTQAMLISNAAQVSPLSDLLLGGVVLEWKDVVLDLGLLIDSELHFDRQVTKICSKVYGALHRLRLLKFLTPKAVRLKLCKALLVPQFFYCDVIWSGIRSMDLDRLEVAFNSCTRYVFGIRRHDRLSTKRKFLLKISFRLYFDYRVVSFFFRVILSKCPVYLFSDLRRLGARTGNYDFPVPYHVGSVLARAIRLYNHLSPDIKNSCSVAAFERRVFALYEQNDNN
jgi:Reverse transcriptase (RNA-dependent DNA polymerase)